MRPTKELPSDTLDAQEPALHDGLDLVLVDRPALAPFFTAKPLSGGALNVRVVAHPDAEAACERVEPFDQRGLRLAGFSTLAQLGHQGGEGELGEHIFFFIRVCGHLIEPSAVFLDEYHG